MHGPSFNLFVFNCVPPKIVSVTFWTVCKASYDVLKLRFKKTLTLLLKEWKRLALGKLPTSHATEKKTHTDVKMMSACAASPTAFNDTFVREPL